MSTTTQHSRPQNQPPAGMTPGDIYFVLFRHKRKIFLFTLLGVVAAAYLYLNTKPYYESRAELLIQYVPEAQSLSAQEGDGKVIQTDPKGAGIIKSEIQILTSLDVIKDAVSQIGATQILPRLSGSTNIDEAATFVQKNLEAAPAERDSAVVEVTLSLPRPEVVQPLLQAIIQAYLQKHRAIHAALLEHDELLSREQTALQRQLNDTDQELANLKNKANMISLQDSQKGLAEMIAKVTSSIFDAQAQLAGYQAALKEIAQTASPNRETSVPQSDSSPQRLRNYQDLNTRLSLLRKRKIGYLVQGYTKDNVLVRELEAQIAETEKALSGLTSNHPMLASLETADASGSKSLTVPEQANQIAVLKAKIQAWKNQLASLQTQATNLNNLALTIDQLERTKAIQQANYQNLCVSVEKSRIARALDPGKTTNIKSVQSPSPPFQDVRKTYKAIAGVGLGGLLTGLAWAFFIELILDRSIKRPIEVENKLKLPLFLSIPHMGRNGHARLFKQSAKNRNGRLQPEQYEESAESGEPTNGALQLVSLEKNRVLEPFYVALRDRLIVQFEMERLAHKPKLVGVTGVQSGAGVSTVAAGLAASLSETGDGSVLLVDMNQENGAAQHFYRGEVSCGLDVALQSETKTNALVQENLYVVNGNNSDELSLALPKRFATLVPQLKASEFDYIIFDLPHLTQTSITSRLARYMDMLLLVVEAEKTGTELVTQANKKLGESGASVNVVLNKTRRYVPSRLHQEFLND